MIEEITISSSIDSEFEFEMVAQGVSLQDANVLFQTEINPDLKYDVRCKHITADRWGVTIPKELIPNGAYNFKLLVVIDDFYFEPAKGLLRVVSEEKIEIFGAKPEPKTKAKQPKKETKTEVKETKEEPTKVAPIKEALKDKKVARDELIQRILEDKKKARNNPIEEEVVEEVITEEVEVIPEEAIEEVVEETVESTPTIKVEVTPTPESLLSERSIITERKRRDDANKKVNDILESLKKAPTAPEVIPDVTSTLEPGAAFKELEEIKESNTRREKNKAVKKAIEKSKKK